MRRFSELAILNPPPLFFSFFDSGHLPRGPLPKKKEREFRRAFFLDPQQPASFSPDSQHISLGPFVVHKKVIPWVPVLRYFPHRYALLLGLRFFPESSCMEVPGSGPPNNPLVPLSSRGSPHFLVNFFALTFPQISRRETARASRILIS